MEIKRTCDFMVSNHLCADVTWTLCDGKPNFLSDLCANVENDTSCDVLASQGKCESDLAFMSENCRKSCNRCGDLLHAEPGESCNRCGDLLDTEPGESCNRCSDLLDAEPGESCNRCGNGLDAGPGESCNRCGDLLDTEQGESCNRCGDLLDAEPRESA